MAPPPGATGLRPGHRGGTPRPESARATIPAVFGSWALGTTAPPSWWFPAGRWMRRPRRAPPYICRAAGRFAQAPGYAWRIWRDMARATLDPAAAPGETATAMA